MSANMKVKKKHKKESAKDLIQNFDPNVCVFCKKTEDNEDCFGKLIRKCNLTVHYFCMLFSSGLGQRGESEEHGVLGFLPQDILKEVRRGTRLRCTFCKHTGATIGCVVSSCRKVFHFDCGRNNSTLHQYYDSYRSFCEEHRPRQNNSMSDRLAFYGTANTLCAICMSSVEARTSNETLRAPCCRNSWFHRSCIQRHATAAGLYFFKCPLCNNKEMFQAEMLQFGIYLPDQDAAWEREPNAFNELLERYMHCDALLCKCPHGREYNKDGGKWEIILCDWCGSKGTHVGCHSLHKIGNDDVCADCKLIDEKSRKETGLPKRKKPSKKARFSSPQKKDTNLDNSLDADKAKSEYPGHSGVMKKSTPPLQKKFSRHKKPVSPGTVLRLSYEETDDDVVVDDSDEDLSLSEYLDRKSESHGRKRKKSSKHGNYVKKLRRTRSHGLSECSLDESENSYSSNMKKSSPGKRLTTSRKIKKRATATVTKGSESESSNNFKSKSVVRVCKKVNTCITAVSKEKNVSKHRLVELKKRKRDPFSFIPSKKRKSNKYRFHKLKESGEKNMSKVVQNHYETDDSQYADSEATIPLSDTDGWTSSTSMHEKDSVNLTSVFPAKSLKSLHTCPSESTPNFKNSSRNIAVRSSPRTLLKQGQSNMKLRDISPVKNLDITKENSFTEIEQSKDGRNSILEISSCETSFIDNEENCQSKASKNESLINKLTYSQVSGVKKGKVRGKYNKLKKDANQMSIKLWLQGSSSNKSGEDDSSSTVEYSPKCTGDNRIVNKRNSPRSQGEQRRTLVIKWKGKRFIVRRTIKDNVTIKKTLEIDRKSKSPEKLRVKPLVPISGKNMPSSCFMNSSDKNMSRLVSNCQVKEESHPANRESRLRSSSKDKLTKRFNNGEDVSVEPSKVIKSAALEQKNRSSPVKLTSSAVNSGYPTRKAISDQKKNLSSLATFPDDILYSSPRKSKCTLNGKFDDVYLVSPSREIDLKSESDTSSTTTVTENLTTKGSQSRVILDANENICHITESESEVGISDNGMLTSGKDDSDDEVIIMKDSRSKASNSVELSPVGDTYQCLIVNIGGKDVSDKDLEGAQYLSLSLKQNSCDDTSANESDLSGTHRLSATIENISSPITDASVRSLYSDQGYVNGTSTFLLQSVDSNQGIQQLQISVPNTS